MRPKPQNCIKSKLKEFSEHSSLHGLYYLYGSSNYVSVGVWCCVIVACAALCGFLSHMIWEKFDMDPTLTVVETTRHSTGEIPFPAVAVCDSQPVYGPRTDNITHILSLRGYSGAQITEFYKSFSEVRNKDYTPQPYVRKMHFHLEGLGYTYNNLLYTLMKPCEELLVQCWWRSRAHNCSELFRPVFTLHGYCCQFDIHYFRNNSVDSNFMSGVRVTEGLELTVNGQTIDHHNNTTTGYLTLYTFECADKLSLLTNAVVITPQVYFDIKLHLAVIDSSHYVRQLPLRKRKCFIHTDKGLSYETCLTRIIIKKVVNLCRCLPFEFTAEELNVDYSETCGWDQLRCIFQNLGKVEESMRAVISGSRCYQRCDYVQYQPEIEFLKYRTHYNMLDEFSSHISVHFSETTCIKYRREILYSWDQMLANLGGIFGLCLGGSIISVIELIWFLFELIYTLIQNKLTNSKIVRLRKKKVFIVHNVVKDQRVSRMSGVNNYKFVH